MEPQLLTLRWCSSYANHRSASKQLDSEVQLYKWNTCCIILYVLYVSRHSLSFWKWSFELWTIQQPSNQQSATLPTRNSHQLWEDTSVALHPMGWKQCKGFPKLFILKLCNLFSESTAINRCLCCINSLMLFQSLTPITAQQKLWWSTYHP